MMFLATKYPEYQNSCVGSCAICHRQVSQRHSQVMKSLGMKANLEGGESSLSHNNASIVFLSHMRLDGQRKRVRENQGRPIQSNRLSPCQKFVFSLEENECSLHRGVCLVNLEGKQAWLWLVDKTNWILRHTPYFTGSESNPFPSKSQQSPGLKKHTPYYHLAKAKRAKCANYKKCKNVKSPSHVG